MCCTWSGRMSWMICYCTLHLCTHTYTHSHTHTMAVSFDTHTPLPTHLMTLALEDTCRHTQHAYARGLSCARAGASLRLLFSLVHLRACFSAPAKMPGRGSCVCRLQPPSLAQPRIPTKVESSVCLMCMLAHSMILFSPSLSAPPITYSALCAALWRFATTMYALLIPSGTSSVSAFDTVPGGIPLPVRLALLRRFPSLAQLMNATVATLREVPNVTAAQAAQLYQHFSNAPLQSPSQSVNAGHLLIFFLVFSR